MGTVDKLHELVDNAIVNEVRVRRDYLGASGLGAECARQVWYSHHTPKPVDNAQTLRKFSVGHALEPIVVGWLKNAGLQIWTHDSEGNQFGFVDGKIAGHCDLVIKGIPGDEDTPYLGEIKTSNGFYFKQFQKDGIDCNDKYKGQVQIYMHKFKLKKCLFIVLNKDTQELYFEIIKYDEFEAVRLLERGHLLAEMSMPPERHYPSKSWFKCRFCNYNKECWD